MSYFIDLRPSCWETKQVICECKDYKNLLRTVKSPKKKRYSSYDIEPKYSDFDEDECREELYDIYENSYEEDDEKQNDDYLLKYEPTSFEGWKELLNQLRGKRNKYIPGTDKYRKFKNRYYFILNNFKPYCDWLKNGITSTPQQINKAKRDELYKIEADEDSDIKTYEQLQQLKSMVLNNLHGRLINKV